MAFETLILTLGRLFEPYVIRLLPFLLVCFGDGNKDVRDAAEDAAKAIVKYVFFLCASACCLSLLVPCLLFLFTIHTPPAPFSSIHIFLTSS